MKKGTSGGRLAIQILCMMLATLGGSEGRPLLALPQSIIVVEEYARSGGRMGLSDQAIQRLWQAFEAQKKADENQYFDLYGSRLQSPPSISE